MKDTIEHLRSLEAAATPGPWISRFQGTIGWESLYAEQDGGRRVLGGMPAEDAHLIAAMRNALPKLLAVVDAAQRDPDPSLELAAALDALAAFSDFSWGNFQKW